MKTHNRILKSTTFKSLLATTTLLTAASFVATPALAVDDLETPMGEQVVGGSASFDRPELGQLNIHQSTNRLVINWDSFNIGKDAKTEFFQPGSNSLAVNRVLSGKTDPTKILGTLKANGQVMVLDRNGVFFGQGAIIDTNGIIASTGDISNEAVMRGDTRLELSNFGDGEIVNEGTITVGQAGIAAFVAPTVKNNGFINAKMGKVALAAGGEKVTLDLYGDNLLELAVDDAKGKALIENTGTIAAEGGVVTLSANAAKDVVDDVINMDGVIEVSSITQKGGKIILSGGSAGKVNVTGKMKATGKTGGGAIGIKGQDVTIAQTADLDASATDNGDGGTVQILGTNSAYLLGSAAARGGANGGNGGFIELSSDNAFNISGSVDTSAVNGTRGTFLLDPRDLELRLGNRTSLFDLNLYEGDIEALSFLTDITLQARRNFTVSSGQYGAGSDGVISLADNSNLTITTSNSPYSYTIPIPFFPDIHVTEADNAGGIDLTGNSTYGSNLEWKTGGTGSISILAATDNDQAGNIFLSKLTTDGGDITVNTNNGSIVWAGDVNSNGGAILGSSTQGQTIAKSLSSDGGNIDLDNAATSFGNIIQITSAGALNSDGGDINIDNNGSSGGFIEHYGSIDSGAGNTWLNGRQNKLFNGSTVSANELSFNGSSVIQQSGSSIVAETLKGALAATASFLGLNNNIASVGDFATGTANWSTGGFTLANGGARRLNVTGTVSTTGGDIDISNANRMDVKGSGALLSDGGNIALSATNNSFLYGDGLIDARGTGATGDVTMNAGSTVVLRTGNIFADDLHFTGKTVSQDAASTIIARNLTGSLEKAARFSGSANDIDEIGDFTTGLSAFNDGGFSLHDVDGFEIKGTVSATGGDIAFDTDANSFDDIIKVAATGSVLSNGGNIAFDNNGSSGGFIDVYGNVDSGTGNTWFNGRQNRLFNGSTVTANELSFTGSSVDQKSGSTIIATTLKGALAATASFLGLNNDVDEIGDFATGTAGWSTGGLTLHDIDGFEVNGTVSSTGGDIAFDTDANSFDDIIKVAATGSVLSNGGNIAFDNNGSSGGFIDVYGNVDSGTGNTWFNGRQNRLFNGSTVTANELSFTGSSVDQKSGSIMTATTLRGSLAATAKFLGTGNDIGTLADFATGTAGWSTGGLQLVDTNGLNATGPVTSTGGDIDISSDGSVWSEGTILSGSIESQGGNVRLSNNKGNVIVTNSGNLDADMGDVDFISNGSDIQLQGFAQVTGGTVNFEGGQVTQSGNSILTAKTLTGSILKFAHLDGVANDINTLGDFAVGAANWYNDANGLRVVDTNGLNVTGPVTSTGGDIDISSDGSVWSEGTILSGSIESQGGNVRLSNNKGNVIVTNSGNLDADMGDVDFISNGSDIQLQGNSYVEGGTVNFEGGQVTQSGNSTLIAKKLTGSVLKFAHFDGVANAIDAIGNFAVGVANWYNDANGLRVVDTDGINIMGPVSSTGGDIDIYSDGSSWSEGTILSGALNSQGGNVRLSNNKGNLIVTNSGNLNADMGDVDFISNGSDIQLQGLAQVTGGTVNFEGGQLTQGANSILTAKKLTGSVLKFAHLDGVANDIDELGDFFVGTASWYNDANGFRLVNASDLNITGTVSTTGADIEIANNGVLSQQSTSGMTSQGGNISISTGTGFNQNYFGLVDARGSSSTGNVTLNSGSSLYLTGADAKFYADTLDLNAEHEIIQSGTGLLEANLLTGTSGWNTNLFSLNNDIGILGQFNTGLDALSSGGFSLMDINDLQVDGPVTSDGGAITLVASTTDPSQRLRVSGDILSNGGNIYLISFYGNLITNGHANVNADTGDVSLIARKNIRLNGHSAITGNLVTLASNNNIRQKVNSSITANKLTGTAQKFATLDGLNNMISGIGDFVTGLSGSNPLKKEFRLNNISDLTLKGDIETNGGDINIVNDGNFVVTSGSANAMGGNINIYQTGYFDSLGIDTILTSGTGTIDLNQNDGGSLNSIIGAVENTGTGLNTIVVGAGTYTGQANVLEDNFLLLGANAGIPGQDPRGPESMVTAPGASGFYIGGDNIIVDGFEFANSTNGIQLEGADNVLITNSVFDNNTRGVYASGGALPLPPTPIKITTAILPPAPLLSNNGYIALSANQFNNNTTAASFESGTIDLTGAPNNYIGGSTALRFAPFALGGGSYAPLSLVDNTIGFGFFEGQTNYFVQLANGAFFAPGSPTVMNGLDATYVTSAGTFRPRDSLPLTAEQLNFLEQKFFHYTDDNTLGLFFYGQPDLNEEDFLRTYGEFIAPNGALSLTIRGLPFVDQSQFRTAGNGFGGGAGGGGFSAAALANISPAAGGDGEFSPEDLANLEPAAGGEDVSCWGDALNGAFNGETVNFSFGSGVAALSGAASCASGTF